MGELAAAAGDFAGGETDWDGETAGDGEGGDKVGDFAGDGRGEWGDFFGEVAGEMAGTAVAGGGGMWDGFGEGEGALLSPSTDIEEKRTSTKRTSNLIMFGVII